MDRIMSAKFGINSICGNNSILSKNRTMNMSLLKKILEKSFVYIVLFHILRQSYAINQT